MTTPPPRYRKGDAVLRKADRSEVGRVDRAPELDAGDYWYRVRFAQRTDNLIEDQLEPLGGEQFSIEDLAREGRWGPVEALRRVLTVERLEHKNRSTVYAFNAQRVNFHAYQYKPLLLLLDSADRRLLVADEVGLGKTIEAGLILAELEARQSPERVLVVCPSRLRQKWCEEMNRKFGEDFEIFDKKRLEAYLALYRENPQRGRLRGVISMQTIRTPPLLNRVTETLDSLDLLIVDEAHHARNTSTNTAEMLRQLCLLSNHAVLLTATPLHLGRDDLFTLLQALRPGEFRNAEVFASTLEEHQPIHEANNLIRARDASLLPAVAENIHKTFQVHDTVEDPLAAQVIERLSADPPTDRQSWLDLEREVEQLHVLSKLVTRTRKRDVLENAPHRDPHVVRCHFNEEENRRYQDYIGDTDAHGWPRGAMSIGQIQRARMAASCLPAAVGTLALPAPRQDYSDVMDLDAEELGETEATRDEAPPSRPAMQEPRLPADSKLEKLIEILQHIEREEPGAKVLIFTYFRGTSHYLVEQLGEIGIHCERIAGDVVSRPRDPERDVRGNVMRRFQEDPGVRILVSTEVGSEGLDFQFCHYMVNYDLPWNPMVVEQRIGRIDRFGQTAEVVHIYSLVVEGSVEDRILERLYQRIGIFERSIGTLEAILGDTVSALRRDFFNGKLSPEEAVRRADQAADAIRREEKHLEQLESRAGELFGHEEFIRDEMERVRRLGRFITGQSLLSLVKNYLARHHPSRKVVTESEKVYSLKLDEKVLGDIRMRVRSMLDPDAQIRSRIRDGRFRFTTDGELAFRRPELDLLNASHPMVLAAKDAFLEQLADQVARLAQARLLIPRGEDDEIAEGLYYLVVSAHIISGMRARRILDTVGFHVDTRSVLDSETGERLLHLVTQHATEWERAAGAPPLDEATWKAIQSTIRSRNREQDRRETNESEALYLRRKRALEKDQEYHLQAISNRLQTARARGKAAGVRLFEAQMQKQRQRFDDKLRGLDESREVSIRLSDPLAVVAVDVKRA